MRAGFSPIPTTPGPPRKARSSSFARKGWGGSSTSATSARRPSSRGTMIRRSLCSGCSATTTTATGCRRRPAGPSRQGPCIETVEGRTILLAHSYDQLQGELNGQGRFDLVLFGHTHRPLTMHVGKALVWNPGEACGLLKGKYTCAIVDLATMEPRIVEIPLPPEGE